MLRRGHVLQRNQQQLSDPGLPMPVTNTAPPLTSVHLVICCPFRKLAQHLLVHKPTHSLMAGLQLVKHVYIMLRGMPAGNAPQDLVYSMEDGCDDATRPPSSSTYKPFFAWTRLHNAAAAQAANADQQQDGMPQHNSTDGPTLTQPQINEKVETTNIAGDTP